MNITDVGHMPTRARTRPRQDGARLGRQGLSPPRSYRSTRRVPAGLRPWGLGEATCTARTDHIANDQDLQLEQKGHAYEIDGTVYYTSLVPCYGKHLVQHAYRSGVSSSEVASIRQATPRTSRFARMRAKPCLTCRAPGRRFPGCTSSARVRMKHLGERSTSTPAARQQVPNHEDSSPGLRPRSTPVVSRVARRLPRMGR